MTGLSLAEAQLGQAGTHEDLGPLSQSDGSPVGKEEAGGEGERKANVSLATEPPPHPALRDPRHPPPRRAFL